MITMRLKLPWKYKVLSVLSDGGAFTYVLTEKVGFDGPGHKYVVHRVFPDGSCEHGDYLDDFQMAQNLLVRRFYCGGAPHYKDISSVTV